MGFDALLFLASLQDFGWTLRQDIIWHKPNPMPESVTDRCTKSHEYIFLLSKKSHYYFDYQAIREEGDKRALGGRWGGRPCVSAAICSPGRPLGAGGGMRSGLWAGAVAPFAGGSGDGTCGAGVVEEAVYEKERGEEQGIGNRD